LTVIAKSVATKQTDEASRRSKQTKQSPPSHPGPLGRLSPSLREEVRGYPERTGMALAMTLAWTTPPFVDEFHPFSG